MRLTRVQIKNFRSISDVTISFEPRCRILVGINESGKSNILRALALLDPTRLPVADDLRSFPPEEDPSQKAFVRFVFSLDKTERIENFQRATPKVLAGNLSTPIITYNGKQLSLEQFFDSRTEGLYSIDIRTGTKSPSSWSLSSKDYQTTGEWKKPSKSCPTTYEVTRPDGTQVPLNNFAIIENSLTENIPEEYLEEIESENVNDLVHEQIVQCVKANLPACLYWSYSESSLLPGQISLDAFAAKPSICEPLKHMFALADIQDINTEIANAKTRTNGIRNLLNRVAARATKHVKGVWRDYRGIEIDLAQNGGNIDASIKDELNHYDFSRRSDGFKRFITFLLMVSAKQRTEELVDTLYLHDEPDISLHPSSARHLRDELIKISANNYVVFSTHSIFMIDRELIGRHLIVAKKKEITTIREVNDSNIVDEEIIYNAVGYSIFESLKKFNIVFEGWRDKRLFQVALQGLPAEHKALKKKFVNIGVCHAKGVKDIGRITPMLELADRDWIIISDGDKPALEQQRLYDGVGKWIRYDELSTTLSGVTGEDFLRPEAFRTHLNAIRSEHPDLPELDLAELAGNEPKLNVLRRWLQQSGIIAETQKKILESLKEYLFNNLKPSQIEKKYFDLLSVLAIKIPSNAKSTT